ncbi:metallophosphoesterase [Bdellovibrio bacteriovorus]|uniref:metallophosphoesterase n=1 Tax=Bdellovibrio bacteriovorus TaxID=959 RepID=UPI0035A63E01
MVRLLHLSDIHFSKRSNTHYDLDQHVRDMLLAELKEQLVHGAFTGCVITGDIGYSGAEIEYKAAFVFLTDLSRELGFPLGSIWIVPGNHDYDRKSAGDSIIVRDLVEKFRKIKEQEITKQVEVYSTSLEHKEKLFSPLNAYVDFAKQFNCEISPEKSFWDIQIPLSDTPNIYLYIRGMNSCLISSFEDSHINDQTRMIMSLRQCQLGPKSDGVRMSLCHHPIKWLRNGSELQTQLSNSFDIQLYGHEHTPRIDEFNDSVLIHAGAVHPERDEGAAMPSYNILEFTVHPEEMNEVVKLNVVSRSYDFKNGRFITIEPRKGHGHRYSFRLPKQAALKQNVLAATTPAYTAVASAQNSQPAKLDEQLAIRTLQVHFYTLSFYQQLDILQKLGLSSEADSENLEKKRFGPFFQRAKDRNLLGEVWQKVSDKLSLNEKTVNPFR